MPPPPKRRRTHSRTPSPPLLPSHLTSLAPTPASSSTASRQRVPPAQAWEATLLPSLLQWEPGVQPPADVCWKGRVLRANEGDNGDEGEEVEVRTDRYDILHLLPSALTLPVTSAATTAPADPRGFTHLPALHEELFFLTPAERAAVAHKERRRKMEEEREERVREVERLEREEAERVRRAGGEDDEPDATQLALMTRLHSTLSSSPNPSLLELRILANHSKDERFSFLREGGRWRSVWGEIRRGERGADGQRVEKERGGEEAENKGILGLVAYGSDSDEEEQEQEAAEKVDAEVVEVIEVNADAGDEAEAPATETVDPPHPAVSAADADAERRAKQALKAERAREWARRRQEAREAAATNAKIDR